MKKYFLRFSFLAFRFVSIGFVSFFYFKAEASNLQIPFQNLRYANRAQCALDSESPTTSIFTIIDGYNSGRVSSAVAKALGKNTEEFPLLAMREFRTTVAGLQGQILEKLLRGQLPLLPQDLSPEVKTTLKNYKDRALRCDENIFCQPLREYIGQIWMQSQQLSLPVILENLKAVDNFDSSHFVSTQFQAQSSCLYLKKFSPLQGPLHSVGIDSVQLTNLAKAIINPEPYVTSCQDTDPALDSRNVALQVDIQNIPAEVWNEIGFDFWNSFKIYLSWAWRYSDEMARWSPQFQSIFRNIDFEESVLFISNSCQSITPPKCDSQTLSMNAIRELAKKTGTVTEFDSIIPPSPDKNLIDRGARAVNNDFLETESYEKASEWVANFRKNFVETRWVMKNKVFNANQTMTVVARSFQPDSLVEYIKSQLLSANPSDLLRDEAAYLCLEWRLSSDQKLDFLRTDIDRVAQLEKMTQVQSQVGLSVGEQIQYFQSLSQALAPLCDQLEQSDFFHKDSYQTNWVGLEAWAKELTKSSLAQGQNEAIPFIPFLPETGAFLTLGTNKTVFCSNAIDCARKVFKAAVDLYSASTYAEAFLPVASTVNSADVFNPYAELKACKVYDPWFVQNRARKVFIADLLNTGLVGWNPIPIYMDIDFTAPKVTSFNKLLEDGKIRFDPNIQKSKITGALLADFGPMLGAPCAVQISPSADKSFNFYAFSGISLNYCHVRAQRDSVADRPDEIQASDPNDASYCAGCTMNFVGVASSASVSQAGAAFNPLKFGVYLFRAVYRFFKSMQDTTNIPRSYQINLQQVVDAYHRYDNRVPEFCVESLSQGLRCYQDLCASKLAGFIENETGQIATEVSWTDDRSGSPLDQRKMGRIKVPACDGEISIAFSCHKNSGSRWAIYGNEIQATGRCQKWVQNNL